MKTPQLIMIMHAPYFCPCFPKIHIKNNKYIIKNKLTILVSLFIKRRRWSWFK